MAILANIVRDNRFRPEDVSGFERRLFFEGERRRPYLEKFTALLFLATVIASMGILGDSTATVIGAMIIAPLMTPIMATAAALVMGNIPRATASLLLVLFGVAGVVALSWLCGNFYTGVISFTENAQITGRTSPRLIDLIAALASGAAGAFCLSRDDIADSLPGVAIAISLVPPLCVVGIALSAGEQDAALGAGLLFVTNFLSILLAGGGVLGLLGLNRAAMIEIRGTARRKAFATVAIATLMVAVPLLFTGRRIAQDARAEIETTTAATEWVSATEYEVRLVRVAGDMIAVTIAGHGPPPAFGDLVAAVRSAVGRPMTVNLEVIPAEHLSSAATAP